MRVAELRDLLGTLPDDMLVLVEGVHVQFIRKEGARSWPVCVRVDRCEKSPACPGERIYENRPAPAYIDICHMVRHMTVGRASPDPQVMFYGRWPRASRAVIDRYSEEPDADGPTAPSPTGEEGGKP